MPVSFVSTWSSTIIIAIKTIITTSCDQHHAANVAAWRHNARSPTIHEYYESWALTLPTTNVMNSPRQPTCSLARRGPRGSSTHGIPPLLLIVSAALALLLPTTAAQSTDAPCFFPNSTAAVADMSPCGGGGADTTHSHCCNQGWACLSNGLCMAAGQDPAQLAGATLVRGACTDQTWTSPDCPRWCTNAEDIDNLNVPQPIAACQAVPGAFYCANSDDAADCDEEEEVIRFSGGTPSAVTTIGVSPTSTSGSSSATSGGASQTSTSPADAATSAVESGSGGGGGGGGDSNALEIGLGVGIGVGGLGVLAALIFFFLWRRRVQKTKAAADALEANEAAAAASSPTDADGEKGTLSSAGPWSPVSGSSELPTTVSRDVQEAGADSAVFEAPVEHTTAGRVEAPEDPRRFEVPVFQGTQGRHELA